MQSDPVWRIFEQKVHLKGRMKGRMKLRMEGQMTLEWKLYCYIDMLSKCQILLVLQAKSLIGCIIFIIIDRYSHAYMCIMILLGLISTYNFDYDFCIIWYRVNSIWVWYDCMIFSIIITVLVSLSSYPITCRNHQVTYHLVNSGYYDFECVLWNCIE